jgi:hypothetical protein
VNDNRDSQSLHARTRLRRVHIAQAALTSSPYSHDTLELAMATASSLGLSLQDSSALVWLLIVGVPSADKTETVRALKDLAKVLYVDTLTDNAFASGYVDPDGKAPKADLLTRITKDKVTCLVVKDLTTLLSMRDDKVKKILGDLQSIYDGEFAKATGTKDLLSYNVKFAVLACVTPAAFDKHHRYMSRIGSRFLIYRIPGLTPKARQEGYELSWNSGDRPAGLRSLRHLVNEHVSELLSNPAQLKPESQHVRSKMNTLAELLRRARTDIAYGKHEDTTSYEIVGVQTEEPWRALQQIRNLGRALARVHGRDEVTTHELELLRRVVLSSFQTGWLKVLTLFRTPGALSRDDVKERIGQSYGRVLQLLNELVAAELLVMQQTGPKYTYAVVKDFAELVREPIEPLDHIGDLDAVSLTQDSPLTNASMKEGNAVEGGESYGSPIADTAPEPSTGACDPGIAATPPVTDQETFDPDEPVTDEELCDAVTLTSSPEFDDLFIPKKSR